MKILVTGGAGFIGSHVVDAYVKVGYEVVVVDDLSTGRKEYLHPQATFYNADIGDKLKLADIFAHEKPAIVNHHAAQVDVAFSEKKPEQDAQVNIIGTINLLDVSRQYHIKKFIFASSAAVYGNESNFSAENITCKPISPYGMSKLQCEEYIKYYGRVHNLHFTILRYPNVYGPRHETGEGGVIQIFFKKMMNNEPVVIFGKGNQTRDFIFVEDVAQANMIVTTNEKAIGEIFNISTGTSVTINAVFDMIKKLIGYAGEKRYEPERKGDILNSSLNNHQAENQLNWKPHTDLHDGLIFTYEALKHERST